MPFDTDEMIYLNKNAVDLQLPLFLNRLKMHITICLNDDELADFLKALYSKVVSFTDKDWDTLQEQLPFRDLQYNEYDIEEYSAELEESNN